MIQQRIYDAEQSISKAVSLLDDVLQNNKDCQAERWYLEAYDSWTELESSLKNIQFKINKLNGGKTNGSGKDNAGK